MKNMRLRLSLLLLLAIGLTGLNAQTTIDYFGQTPPGNKAVKFAPGIISLPNRLEGKIVFSPDGNECYFDVEELKNNDFISKIYFTKRVNNLWTEQVELPLSVSISVKLSGLSADGKKLYIEMDNDIWMVERAAGGWGEPQRLPFPINTASTDHSYSETADSVIYIGSNRPGGLSKYYDIWRIRPSSNQAEHLGPIINSKVSQSYPCIAPDGSYLIFGQIINEPHLVISFNKGNDEWTVPVDMDRSGAGINILNQDSPTLSPDGKYLFFRPHSGFPNTTVSDIYWVSTNIIPELKKIAYAPKLSKQIPAMNIKTDSVINYVIPENTFTCEYATNTLKYTATLKNGAALPSWLTFDPTTRMLSGTPKQAGTDSVIITATNKDNLSATSTFKLEVSPATGVKKSDAHTLKIYPNPSSGVFNFNIGNASAKNAKVEIYDFTGKMVLSNVCNKRIIDLTDCQKGIYVAKIYQANEVFIEKLLIK